MRSFAFAGTHRALAAWPWLALATCFLLAALVRPRHSVPPRELGQVGSCGNSAESLLHPPRRSCTQRPHGLGVAVPAALAVGPAAAAAAGAAATAAAVLNSQSCSGSSHVGISCHRSASSMHHCTPQFSTTCGRGGAGASPALTWTPVPQSPTALTHQGMAKQGAATC